MTIGRKIVIGVMILITLAAAYYVYGYYNKALSGEEFMTRMSAIGYTGNENGSPVKSNDPTYAKRYIAMGNRNPNEQYSRIQLDVFKEKQDAADSFESWVAFYREHSDALEVEEDSSTKFIAYDGERYILFSLVKDTVLSATIPESDVDKFEAALTGTAYIQN